MNACTAVLMAGGDSSRMGRDKAFLDFRGAPLWKFQLAKLQAVAGEVLISAREDAFASADAGCRIVSDQAPRVGPLGGLRAAMNAATFDRVLLLGIDMPGMTAAYLTSLVEKSSAACGVVPQLHGFYQGLAAVYPREIGPLLDEVLSGSDHSFQNLIRQGIARGLLQERNVKPEEEILFQNWNIPADRIRYGIE